MSARQRGEPDAQLRRQPSRRHKPDDASVSSPDLEQCGPTCKRSRAADRKSTYHIPFI
jgi:hypothetical protein